MLIEAFDTDFSGSAQKQHEVTSGQSRAPLINLTGGNFIRNSMVMSGTGDLLPLSGDVDGGKQPDADHIKMFVGQLPRSFTEDDVRKLFEEFGSIYQINMLRDKSTGLSKGCCFITFFQRKSALDAQNALHNIRILPSMHNPIQMKPADTENRSERKLFVGMISKKSTEEDIRKMFGSFGTIEECTVLRDGNGTSRGCAFVTFSSRQSALNAIRNLHHSATAEGCTSPLVVKMADTTKDKEKDGKRPGGIPVTPVGTPWGGAGVLNPLQQHYYSLLQPANNLYLSSLLGGSSTGLANLGIGLPQLASFAQSSALNPAFLNGLNTNGMSLGSVGDGRSTASPLSNFAALTGGPVYSSGGGFANSGSILQSQLSALNALVHGGNDSGLHALSNLLPLLRPANGTAGTTPSQLASLAGYGNAFSTLSGQNQNGMSNSAYDQLTAYSQMGYGNKSAMTASSSPQSTNASNKQTEGPDGCNLFIYHLPPEYGDSELAQLFSGFGPIISAKVFVDKQTGLSKCFGFVSFNDALSAQQAISSMNGFAIGMKRLKVQLKRSRDKPY